METPLFVNLILDPAVITFVAISSETLVGCTVDDFTVGQAALWATVAVDLVHAVENEAGQRGASQLSTCHCLRVVGDSLK